jgi:probable addiction module antidote protein
MPTFEDVAAYLTSILEENDPALLAAAIGDIVRARGMSKVARRIQASLAKPCTKLFDPVANQAWFKAG